MSLKRLALRDFVIVSELELELGGGFSVLTGETGAGKSILIDALQLVTGGRADVGAIREGASRTDVSAEFDTSPAIDAWLDEAGFDANGSLLLRRTVDAQGKSRPGSMAAPLPPPSCASWASSCWTSTASTPGKASPGPSRCASCSMPMPK